MIVQMPSLSTDRQTVPDNMMKAFLWKMCQFQYSQEQLISAAAAAQTIVISTAAALTAAAATAMTMAE